MNKEKPYITKYSDEVGIRIRVGDLILHGPLRQEWLIKDKNTARIVSDDCGMGLEQDLDVLSLGFRGNNTVIIGSILRESKP